MKNIKNFTKLTAIILTLHLSSLAFGGQKLELFNGNNLDGWNHVGSGGFKVKDHLLVTEGGMGLLYYDKQKFTNVKLTVIYKTSTPTSNSGVFVRVGEKPDSAWYAVNNGYEIQICDSGKEAFDDYHRTGAIYSFTKAEGHYENSPGTWNKMEILLKEEFIKVYLNGHLVTSFLPNVNKTSQKSDSDPARGPRAIEGYIGIQNHDHTAKESNDHVYFKSVTVEPIN